MLHRTTILLPPALKSRAVRMAAEKGISFGELVRAALEKHVMQKHPARQDAFLDDMTFYENSAPSDLAQHHDDYLYKK